MVLMLQNLLHYTGDYIWKDQSLLSHDNYPAQNPDFIDKLLFVPYRDENTLTVNFRLPVSKKKHPEFDGHKGPYENYTRVLRFDMGEPYVAILVDTLFNIIVADTRELLKYKIYPRYRYSRYKGFDEAFLPMASNWPEFNELVQKTGLEKLTITVTKMCEMYLGLSPRKWCAEADDSLCTQLMEYIMNVLYMLY